MTYCMYQQNLQGRSRDIEAINFKFPRKKQQNIFFPQCQHKKMENIICDVIIDHFIIKKETICHISVIWNIEVMTLFIQSVRHIGKLIVPELLMFKDFEND